MGVTPRRGRHAAAAGAAALGAARLRALAEVGGREPDRELQGPRHGRRGRARARARRARRRLRLDGQHRGLGGRLRRPRRAAGGDPPARRARSRAASSRRCSRPAQSCARSTGSFEDAHLRSPGGSPTRRAGSTSTRSTPTGSRARPRRRARSSSSSAGCRTCSRSRTAAAATRAPTCAASARRTRAAADPRVQSAERGDDLRLRDPHRRARPPRARSKHAVEVVTVTDDELRRVVAAIARLEGCSASRRRRGGRRRRAGSRPGARRLRAHRPRAQGPGRGRALMSDAPRARDTRPTSGPGSTAPAVALDLWNEVEVTRRLRPAARPGAHRHPRVRARRLAGRAELRVDGPDPARPRARLERGDDRARDGRAAKWTGQELELEDLLARGGPLEGHSDNLAACLAGGVRLTWDGQDRADRRHAPARRRSPSSPSQKVKTAEARLALPAEVPHADATFNVARAALLGAGMAGGAPTCSPPPSRIACTSRTGPRRSSTRSAPSCRAGAVGATLSGSGPDRDRLGRGRGRLRGRARARASRPSGSCASSPRARTEDSLGSSSSRRAVRRPALEARRPGSRSATAPRRCSRSQYEDDWEADHEAEALRFWDGVGAVRLIDHDPETRSMLIERCLPGTPLGTDVRRRALEVAADLLRRLWRPPPADVPWRRLAEAANAGSRAAGALLGAGSSTRRWTGSGRSGEQAGTRALPPGLARRQHSSRRARAVARDRREADRRASPPTTRWRSSGTTSPSAGRRSAAPPRRASPTCSSSTASGCGCGGSSSRWPGTTPTRRELFAEVGSR